ncbi:MAG: pyridoxamine 5'-phosphate oxidase [Dokdonella sp.]
MTNPSSSESDALYQQALATLSALLDEARAAGDPEPTAMTLATAGEGRVSARIVLLKGIDPRGLHFFSNYTSDKGRQLERNAQSALCFHWKTLRDGVQVRVEGVATRLPAAESDTYFATRSRGSQIGAWASLQSQPLSNRDEFDTRIAQIETRFAGVPVPRPPHWGGYVLAPDRIEFWYGAAFRLHERMRYFVDAAGVWSRGMLFP